MSYNVDSQEAKDYCHEDFDTTSEHIEEFRDSQTKVEEFKKLCFLYIYYSQTDILIQTNQMNVIKKCLKRKLIMTDYILLFFQLRKLQT